MTKFRTRVRLHSEPLSKDRLVSDFRLDLDVVKVPTKMSGDGHNRY